MVQIETLQVIADPTRLRLLDALRGGEQTVSELTAVVDIQQSGVSRHLRILQEAGFVSCRPEGTRRLYVLRPEPFVEVNAWLGAFRGVWEARLDRLGRALAQRTSSSGSSASSASSVTPSRPKRTRPTKRAAR